MFLDRGGNQRAVLFLVTAEIVQLGSSLYGKLFA